MPWPVFLLRYKNFFAFSLQPWTPPTLTRSLSQSWERAFLISELLISTLSAGTLKTLLLAFSHWPKAIGEALIASDRGNFLFLN
jgi:hypothetical protein